MKLKPSPSLIEFKLFHEAVKWWNARTEKQQERLAKANDLVTYLDMVAYYQEQKK